MKEEKDKSKNLQTVERALDVLYLFHKYNGITLSFVAEEMNMSTTVAYRLLYTLADSGFLRQEKASKKYYLGEKSLLLGYRAIQSQELEKTAYPIMKNLVGKCGLGVILTSCADMQSLCVEKIDVEDDLQLAMRVGGIYPIHKGASNRPLLAYMEREKADTYIDSLDITEEEKDAMRREMEEIRKRGYDHTQGLLTPGLFSIGFPVFGMRNKLIFCISIGGYCFDMKEEQRRLYLHETRKAAAELSRLFGAEDYPGL